MINFKPQFITDENGKKISVIIPVDTFQAILKELEEKDAVNTYKVAKSEKLVFSDAEEVFERIEKKHKS
jgi:ribosomal protein S25